MKEEGFALMRRSDANGFFFSVPNQLVPYSFAARREDPVQFRDGIPPDAEVAEHHLRRQLHIRRQCIPIQRRARVQRGGHKGQFCCMPQGQERLQAALQCRQENIHYRHADEPVAGA